MTFSSLCQLTIALTFFGSILIRPSLIINPIKSVFFIRNSHFSIIISVTDLVLSVLRILRRDLSELAGSMEPVDPYDEG